jgi:hypothetical protein
MKFQINIFDFIDKDELTETSNGFSLECCPCCADTNYKFNITADGNIGYCQQARKWFNALEVLALKNGIIRCVEGREKGQSASALTVEQWREVCEIAKDLNIGKCDDIAGDVTRC